MDEKLKNIYYNSENPAGFAGVEKLHNEVKKTFPEATKDRVKEFLSSQLTYTLHRNARRKFKRNRIVSRELNEEMQADLIDLQKYAKYNDGFKYILTVIDILSKYAFAIPVKNKGSIQIRDALAKIFKERLPSRLSTDSGKEFTNKEVKDLLKKNQIFHILPRNPETKSAVVERFNRTIKSKIFKYFTFTGKNRYIRILPDILKTYNNTIHRTTKLKPIDVTIDNQDEVFKNSYGADEREVIFGTSEKKSLKKGDQVRLRYVLKPFDKSYYPNWTDETFKIHRIQHSTPKNLYILIDDDGNIQHKKYYIEDIQKVKTELYRIEKIIKYKTLKGKRYALVKFLNYPISSNRWVLESDITSING